MLIYATFMFNPKICFINKQAMKTIKTAVGNDQTESLRN